MEFQTAYNAKDLILYALSIGLGTSKVDQEELQFLYERHPSFSAIPTFCFALGFWADIEKSTCNGIPAFPPPFMSKQELIPKKLLRGDVNLSKSPILHTWQSVVWHQMLPVPAEGRPGSRCDEAVQISLKSRTISVAPKSIGTFVTTENTVMLEGDSTSSRKSLLCSMESTALVLGVPSDKVVAYDAGVPRLSLNRRIPTDKSPLFEWTYITVPTQALLYRLASGDSNRIHVDTSAADMLGSEKSAPLLHGLCTLGIVFRAFLQLVPAANETIRKLEGKFTQPVFVGDVLCVRIWSDEEQQQPETGKRLLFDVIDKDTGVTLVDCGSAEFEQKEAPKVMSKL
jgi:acyl dehydratase